MALSKTEKEYWIRRIGELLDSKVNLLKEVNKKVLNKEKSEFTEKLLSDNLLLDDFNLFEKTKLQLARLKEIQDDVIARLWSSLPNDVKSSMGRWHGRNVEGCIKAYVENNFIKKSNSEAAKSITEIQKAKAQIEDSIMLATSSSAMERILNSFNEKFAILSDINMDFVENLKNSS